MAYLEGAESQEVKQKGSKRHNGACDVEIIRTCKMRSTPQRMQSVEAASETDEWWEMCRWKAKPYNVSLCQCYKYCVASENSTKVHN